MDKSIEAIHKRIQEESVFVEKLTEEVGKVIVGQKYMVERLLIGLLSNGHVLLEGVPGLAKTLTVRTLSAAIQTKFQRIQFTPDLLPADLIGTLIYDQRNGKFQTKKGPIFANVILADEINRSPAKVQSALLEAMQERTVTIGENTFALDDPFLVMATQNPIEQEGTYPLPEAQQDRFMFTLHIDYPDKNEEMEIVETTTGKLDYRIEPAMGGEDVLRIQDVVRNMPVSRHVIEYTTDLVRASRPNSENALSFVKDYVTWGAGPRAAQYLILGVKGNAVSNGKVNISCEDVRRIAKPVLRHRIFTNFNADADGVTVDDVIDKLLETVEEPPGD